MKISQEVSECAAIAERETGRKMTDKALRIAEAVHRMCVNLLATGRQHALEGRNAVDISEIEQLTSGIKNQELKTEIALLMYESYMEGYGHSVTQEGMEIPA